MFLGEEQEEEDVEDQTYDGRVVDDNSEEEGNDKVSLGDDIINNERSDSNFSCGGSSIPNRGISRQLSAKSFRRSVQDTLKHDEDSSIFGGACNSRTSSTGDGLLFGDDSSERGGSSILGGSDRSGIDRLCDLML